MQGIVNSAQQVRQLHCLLPAISATDDRDRSSLITGAVAELPSRDVLGGKAAEIFRQCGEERK